MSQIFEACYNETDYGIFSRKIQWHKTGADNILIFTPLRTLRGKIVLSLIVFIILPVVWIIYRYYDSSTQIIEKQMYESIQTTIERKALTMNELLTRTAKASNLIISDPDILLFLRDTGDWTTDYSDYSNIRDLYRKLSNIRDLLLDNNAYLALYDFKGYMHSTWAGTQALKLGEPESEPWYTQTVQLSGKPKWTLPYVISNASGEKPLLVLTRLLQSEWKNGDGLLMIAVPAEAFFYTKEELAAQEKEGIHSLLVEDGTAIFGDTRNLGSGNNFQYLISDDNQISQVKLQNKIYLVNQTKLPGTGWTLMQLTDNEVFSAQLNQAKNRSISYMLIWFAIFTVAFVGLMFRFTQPIKVLIKSMNRVGKGDLSTEVNVKGRDEVAWLGVHFNRMVNQLKQLISRLSEEQQRKQKAQFQALQAQINPHFLLNTMNSIKWMALLSGANHVSEMLTKLGKLLTYTMRQDEAIVTIRDELDYLNVYMALQEIRYHDQIRLDVEVPEAILDCEIVKFTLQPIIENGILHGKRFPLHIRINGEVNEDLLLLEIVDNGVGLSEEMIQSVEEQMNQPHAKFSGIGMRNVHDRLRLEFGDDYGITMESAPGQGVKVTLRLPVRRKETDHAINDRG
jgi:two-component system sensor histidine kinase YesM